MESWQRDHIRKIKPKLQEYTRCNSTLLNHLKAVNVLSDEDIAEIESKSNKYKQASCFYDIVDTRSNGYLELLKALAECKQTGAVKLLMTGLPTNLLSQLKVRFLGRDHHLSELLEERDISELTEQLKSLNLNKYLALILECNSDVISLFDNTIPIPEKFYVPRYLVKYRNLNKELFTTDCPDVFVFTGYTRAQLSQLASEARCHTASSRNQIEKITSRFILLEDTSHWKYICDIANGLPVHLIRYEEDNYILTKTTGGSSVLYQFLDNKSEEVKEIIRENDVAFLERETSVCICDLPGMGKSILLANLARVFAECNPKTITAFISLPMVAQCLKLITDNQVIDFSLAIRVLSQMLARNEISRQIVFLLLQKRLTPVHIYFDGLDEVPPEFLSVVKAFLKSLKEEEKWIRIHVTARTHMRQELEATLGVIPFDIVPFTHDNKIQFLTNFWKNKDPTSDDTKLAEFANYCLDKWKEHMTEEGVKITGIPLQCRLLAEVYSRHAHRYASESVRLNETEITETSLLQLYHSYLQIGLASVEKQIISSTKNQSRFVAEKLVDVEQYHIWQALKLLYPKYAKLYKKYYSLNTPLEAGEFQIIMAMGFLVPGYGEEDFSVKFVHRTFVEFLVARHFASILSKYQPKNSINTKMIKFQKQTLEYFFKEVANHEITGTTTFNIAIHIRNDIHEFFSHVVMKFVNGEFHNNICFNSLVPLAFSNVVSAESCYGLMISTLVQKLPGILRLVKYALAGLSKFKLWWYKRYFSTFINTYTLISRQQDLVYITAEFANAAVARELYEIFSQIFHLDLYSLHNDCPLKTDISLHYAVVRGDFELVEHFFQYITYCEEDILLLSMIKNSYHDPITVVQNKTLIGQLLYSRNPCARPELYVSKSYATFSITVCNCNMLLVHPCLSIWLLQNGTYIRYKDRTRLLEIAAKKWKADELYDLFETLNTFVNNKLVFKEIEFPLLAVLKYCRDASKLILRIPRVQWDAKDENGNTLIHFLATEDQSIFKIKKCLENGASLNEKNNLGWTGLHVAAAKRNLEIMYYLLDKGASIIEKTKSGDTPLHLFFLNFKALHTFLADMNLVDRSYISWKPCSLNSSSLHELVTKITTLTYQRNEQVMQTLSDKNANGQTILHNFLYMEEEELEMSSETLAIMMDNLHIKVTETDNDGRSLLDSAILRRKNESIIELLRQKLSDV